MPTLHWILAAAVSAAVASVPQPSSSTAPCIAVMPATVTGVDGSAADAGKAVRDVFISMLTGPSMELVPLEARVRQLAIEEAKQKNCVYIVSATLSRKRGGGSSVVGSALSRAAGTAAWYVPGGGAAVAVARGLSVGAAEAVHQITSTTRAKDEIRLEWTMAPLASPTSSTLKKDDKLKASSDGEDLLTPLVQRAAEAIVQAVVK